MKKSLIVVAILLIVIALLPMIGNRVIGKTIDEKVATLTPMGVETTVDESSSSYLNSLRHFEFTLKNPSNKQIPIYIDAMLHGLKFGVDLKYSNLPFAKAVSIDLYPLSLPNNLQDNLKEEDVAFYNYLEKFLQSKGILYHIDYNLLNDEFRGEIKDIDLKHTLKSGIELELFLKDATFKGEGELIAPDVLSTKVKEMHLVVGQESKSLKANFVNFSSKSNFKSQNSYVSNADIDDFSLDLKGTQKDKDIDINLSKIMLNFSSNDQGEYAEVDSKVSLKSLKMKTENESLFLKDFGVDISLSKLNKEKYSELNSLYRDSNEISQSLIQTKVMELLSKGLVLNIAKFSLGKIKIDDIAALDGFDVKSKLIFKEDANLLLKMQISPMMIIPDIEMDLSAKIAKDLYSKLLENRGILANLKQIAKENLNNYIFDIKFKDTKLTVNGKVLN